MKKFKCFPNLHQSAAEVVFSVFQLLGLPRRWAGPGLAGKLRVATDPTHVGSIPNRPRHGGIGDGKWCGPPVRLTTDRLDVLQEDPKTTSYTSIEIVRENILRLKNHLNEHAVYI